MTYAHESQRLAGGSEEAWENCLNLYRNKPAMGFIQRPPSLETPIPGPKEIHGSSLAIEVCGAVPRGKFLVRQAELSLTELDCLTGHYLTGRGLIEGVHDSNC